MPPKPVSMTSFFIAKCPCLWPKGTCRVGRCFARKPQWPWRNGGRSPTKYVIKFLLRLNIRSGCPVILLFQRIRSLAVVLFGPMSVFRLVLCLSGLAIYLVKHSNPSGPHPDGSRPATPAGSPEAQQSVPLSPRPQTTPHIEVLKPDRTYVDAKR